MAKKKKLEEEIRFCLKEYPQTRNSDIELTIRIWQTFYPTKLILREKDSRYYVAVRDLFDLPREDNVKRLRARIQNELGEFLPTDINVVRQRRINEEKWREYLLNNRE